MSLQTYVGMRVTVDDVLMSKIIEDWSKVRSPGRARRRRWKHKQNIASRVVPKEDVYKFGNQLIMHSAVLKKLEAEVAKQARA
jgi:hypothetical protein